MDKLRISKVDDVQIIRRGVPLTGTLHLMPHHLIFCHAPSRSDDVLDDPKGPGAKPAPREVWITYHIISRCIFRPALPASGFSSSIRLQCRDFTFVAFNFAEEKDARDVYESIKSLTCKLGRIERLYAFSYRPQPPEKEVNSWSVYDACREWSRLGITGQDGDGRWRISEINKDYKFSPTYPALLVVPSAISDNVLNYAGRYRSRARIPVLTYLHPVNDCSITRSSQPLAGFRGNRSIQDEKLVDAIFSTSQKNRAHDSLGMDEAADTTQQPTSMTHDAPETGDRDSLATTELLEDSVIQASGSHQAPTDEHVYGAQQRNLIVDARPTVNAYAMQAVGLGSENMDNYKFGTKVYLGIDNIHVMRDSLNKVIEALKDSDITPLPPNRELLNKSGWLKHISGLLDGASLIARQIALQHSHVLIHCSDGWDRTSQLSALSQLCLDPYYRTLEGFIVLVEKDWVSFGHMFRHRSGLLNSEKWFVVQNEGLGSNSGGGPISLGHSSSGGSALENALLTARGFFNKENSSRESLHDSDGEQGVPWDSPSAAKPGVFVKSPGSADKEITKIKETSPVFHQFLDATYQLLHQYPTRFEFNERFLRRLLYHLYSCQYGTFLYNSEKARMESKAMERTRSVWDYFVSRKEQFLNESYTGPSVNEREKGQERLILPRIAEVRWWHEAFGRSEQEMNGQGITVNSDRTVLTGVETAETAIGAGSPRSLPSRNKIGAAQGLSATMAKLGIGRPDVTRGGQDGASAQGSKGSMEVEMQ